MSKYHPMAILLKFEGYPPAVIISVFLHLCLLVFIFGRNVRPSDYVTIEDPVIVTATAVDVNPQRLRRLERIQEEQAADAARQRQEQEARARREQEERARQERQAQQQREAQQAQERADAEQRQREAAERERLANAEAERQRQADETQRRAEEERAREQQRLAQEQAAREAQSNQVASENTVVAEFAAIIKRIISQNWQIPPSARNGMMATVELRLVPTGEVVGATIIKSSGDGVFDRSVMQAVERADRFPELQDLDRSLFDRNFRTFTLVFRPEDLLR